MGCTTRHKRPAKRGLGGEIFSGAASGFSMGAATGNPLLMGIGAVGGAAVGFFKGKKIEEEKKKRALQQSLLQGTSDYYSDLSALQAFDNQYNAALGADMGATRFGVNQPGFNMEIDPRQIAEGVLKVNGPDHSNGGVDVDADLDGVAEYELEGGEVIASERVYSKRLKIPKDFIEYADSEGLTVTSGTFAQVAETLGRLKKTYDDKMVSLDAASVNTGTLMLERIENLYNTLFATQEITTLNRRK